MCLPVVIAMAVSPMTYSVQACTHPGAPLAVMDFRILRTNIDNDSEPWKFGDAIQEAFAMVSRSNFSGNEQYQRQ